MGGARVAAVCAAAISRRRIMNAGVPRLSIAMATYNGARHIEAQLNSFVDQTRRPDELVITDDGSTDRTLAIAEEFARQAPFDVHIHRNSERLGYTRNFERALSLCTGDLISISDQDDVWYPEKLAIVMERFATDPGAQVVVNDQDITGEDLAQTGSTVFTNSRKMGFPDEYLSAGCCTTLRRGFLPLLLPLPGGVAYDAWIGRIADLLGAKSLIEFPLQLYRRHAAATTDTVLAERVPSTLSLIVRFGLKDPREGWRREIETLAVSEERLQSCAKLVESVAGPAKLEQALRSIAGQTAWLECRSELIGRPRLTRAPQVVRLWRSGFYDAQFGLKSAIKDMIRA
jgi:hypothetical protein